MPSRYGTPSESAPREPLFDRITEERSDRPRVHPVLTRDRLIASIQREIIHLLNTRRSSSDMLDPAAATTLDYGIPSFSFRSANSTEDLDQLAALLSNAISIFEPRLINPRVALEPDPNLPNSALGQITGSIRIGNAIEQFSFPIGLDGQSMEAAPINTGE